MSFESFEKFANDTVDAIMQRTAEHIKQQEGKPEKLIHFEPCAIVLIQTGDGIFAAVEGSTLGLTKSIVLTMRENKGFGALLLACADIYREAEEKGVFIGWNDEE